jgi:hypothetical protein
MQELSARLKDPEWTAANAAAAAVATSPEIAALAKGAATAGTIKHDPVETGIMALAGLAVSGLKMPVETSAAASGGGVTPPPKAKTASQESGDSVGGQTRTPQQADAGGRVDRSLMPSLAEGDQYTVTELDAMPAAEAQARKAQSGMQVPRGESPTSVSPSRAPDGTDTETFNIGVPADIAAILEQSAKKLNQGLGGRTESR